MLQQGYVKQMFFAMLESSLDQCPRAYLLILGNFNAVAGTDRTDYEMCNSSKDKNLRFVVSEI